MMEIHVPVPGKASVEEEYNRYADLMEKAVYELQKRIRSLVSRAGLHPTIKYRVKTFESYYQKMLRRVSTPPKYKDWNLITDLLGIRLVSPFMSDLPVIEDILTKEFDIQEREKKGAEFSFKEFGYDSVHYLVKLPQDIQDFFRLPEPMVVEVQLRTILQDAWAEVEHELVYKSDHTPFDESLRRKLAALNANLSLADMIFHEIREYQRELQKQLKKRRSDFRLLVRGGDEVLRQLPHLKDAISPRIPEDDRDIPAKLELEEVPNLPHYDVVDGQLLKAIYAHNAHRYREAITLYTRIESMHPRPTVLGVILVHRGMAQFALGQYDHAIMDFTASLAIEGDHRKALYYRAVAWRQLSQYAKALDDLALCLSVDSYQHDVLLCRGQIWLKLGDYGAALQDVDAALALEPDDHEAKLLRNVLNEKLGV